MNPMDREAVSGWIAVANQMEIKRSASNLVAGVAGSHNCRPDTGRQDRRSRRAARGCCSQIQPSPAQCAHGAGVRIPVVSGVTFAPILLPAPGGRQTGQNQPILTRVNYSLTTGSTNSCCTPMLP